MTSNGKYFMYEPHSNILGWNHIIYRSTTFILIGFMFIIDFN